MIKKLFLIIIFFLLFAQNTLANNFVEKTMDSYKFRYIKYDTESKDYVFKIWAKPDYEATDLRELMEENNWVSAINWVFLCPADYKECGWKNFTKNERYVEWEKLWKESSTEYRAVFALDKNNKPFLFQTDKINPSLEEKIYYWFANFPILLQDWKSKYDDYVEMWLIDKKMKNKMQRNFICSDVTNRYIYTWYVSEIELEKLPDELVKLWCSNALNLDAGKSSAMIYNSRYIIWPGRDVLDWVIIERKGLDTNKLIELSKKLKSIIEKKLTKKSYNEKIEYLDNFMSVLTKIRTKIYDKNSFDIYDETWKKIWYEINIRNIKNLENVYTINYLNKLLYELKKSYIEENSKQIKDEKEKIDQEDLLF